MCNKGSRCQIGPLIFLQAVINFQVYECQNTSLGFMDPYKWLVDYACLDRVI